MPALPVAVGVPGRLAEAPVIAVQFVLLYVVATVCVAFTAPLPPPVYDGKLIVKPVPVLPAEVVKRKMIADAPLESILVNMTWADVRKAADACETNIKLVATNAIATANACTFRDHNFLIS